MDNTPPRNGLIAFYTALAVVSLIAIKPAFDSYYDRMLGSAVADRLATYDDLEVRAATEADWNRRLCRHEELAQLEPDQRSCTGSPITETMARLAGQGRRAIPQIRPEVTQPMNLDPLRGWAELPQEVAEPSPEPPATVEEGEANAPAADLTPSPAAETDTPPADPTPSPAAEADPTDSPSGAGE